MRGVRRLSFALSALLVLIVGWREAGANGSPGLLQRFGAFERVLISVNDGRVPHFETPDLGAAALRFRETLFTLFPAFRTREGRSKVVYRFPLDGAVYASPSAGDAVVIETRAKSAVHPIAEGWVLSVTDDAALGTTITILHADGTVSIYGYLGANAVRPGDWVYPDGVLGQVREQSLYLAIERAGRRLDPRDVIRFEGR
ncbi:MAG: M23 family metallopeptidase [Hydrogenibacillus sp.]|nr:M23 family metallopeptidase [Hydrogenibacillus sp.]